MKLRFKMFSVILSIMITFFSIFESNLIVYASEDIYPPGTSILEKIITEGTTYVAYLGCRLKSLADGDFAKWIQTKDDYIQWWNTGHISISNDVDGSGTPGVVFDEDLTAYLKQAILEYAEETNGFFLMPTTDINTMPPTMFASSYNYNSFKNLVAESGCIAVADERHSSVSFSVFRPFHSSRPISLVRANNLNFSSYCEVNFYDTYSWTKYSFNYRVFYTRYKDNDGYVSYKTFKSWDEAENYSTKGYAHIGWKLVPGSGNIGAPSSNTFVLYSTDGRKLKVFNSLNALKNYTAGQRSVYFGSGFYNDPGEIKVSFDDLEKYIDGKYDDFFNDLKDLINKETDNEDSLTEEDLEKLVDKILNASDGSGGSGSDSGSDAAPSGIIGWLEKIYDKLADMLKQLKSIKRWTVIDTVINGVDAVADWLDLIHDIISDADDGMESAVSTLSSALDDSAGLLKKKFPFSIPWDILAFVTLFAAEPEVPRFEVPIDIGVSAVGLDIHYDFIVDFSDYQYLSDIFRAVLSLTYAVGLIKMTAGIASTKKEE